MEDRVQPAKFCLVGVHVLNPASGKNIDRERRGADVIQLLLPIVDIGADATRAMYENHGWQPLCSWSWNTQHSGDGRWLPIFSAGQEQLLRQRHRLNRVDFSTRHLRATVLRQDSR